MHGPMNVKCFAWFCMYSYLYPMKVLHSNTL